MSNIKSASCSQVGEVAFYYSVCLDRGLQVKGAHQIDIKFKSKGHIVKDRKQFKYKI